jgi:hypothetical protein
MTGPQPGPYPQYPGGSGLPAQQPKPPLPDPMRNAFYLMLAGAALQAIGLLSALAQIGTIRDQIAERVLTQPNPQNIDVDALVNVTIAVIVVFGLLGIGLWIWMAFANKAGKNWARITATVFFGILTVSLLINIAARSSDSTMTAGSSSTAIGTILTVLTWIVGLAAIILLYNRKSSAYFKPPSNAYGYPPGPTSGYPYPPTGPGPAPGQFGPPPAPAPPPGPPPSNGPENMPPPR